MFDNRQFNVNGRSEAMLLKALELAAMQNSNTAGCFRGWQENEKGMILCWMNNTNGIQAFPGCSKPGAGLTASQVLPLVVSWLNSDEAKAIMLSDWDADMDHDGSNDRGWRVYCESWGHVGDNRYAICAVTPAWLWIGK